MGVLKESEFFVCQQEAHHLSEVRVKTVALGPGLTVSQMACQSPQRLRIQTSAADNAHFHFNCLQRGKTRVEYKNQEFFLDKSNVLSAFTPDACFDIECTENWCNIELRITPDRMMELAGNECENFYLNCNRDFYLLRSANGERIRHAAQRLGYLINESNASTLLLYSTALEFLAWHLKSIQPNDTCPARPICPRECRLLQQAHQRLLSDLSNPPTIQQLARETGLNQLKIKRGFKTLFGISVYALFQRERMERAYHLLKHHSVTETASQLGYTNISHFSVAFRKQFGTLPSEVHRGILF